MSLSDILTSKPDDPVFIAVAFIMVALISVIMVFVGLKPEKYYRDKNGTLRDSKGNSMSPIWDSTFGKELSNG